MLKRGIALVAVLGLLIWALLDQWNRYTGAPGGPTFDIATPNPIALGTFAFAILLSAGIAFGPAKHQNLLVVALLVMIGPLWLSTRHVYVSHTGSVIETALLFEHHVQGVDPEQRCFVRRGWNLIAVDNNGRELGSLFVGVPPWSLSNSQFIDVLSAGCR
ncbi:MAG: hypothetical protein ABW199_05760 [Caulobacterales bacterium]